MIAWLAAASSAVWASGHVDVREYLCLRKKLVAPAVPIQTIKSDASSHIGDVFEIRGTVTGTGISNRDSTFSLIISTPRDGSFVVNAEALPDDDPGVELACLVKVGAGSEHSLSDLQLVAFTYDVDLKRMEKAWQDAAREKKARVRAAQPRQALQVRPRSAGTTLSISTEEFVRAYKNAIKRFNHRLSDSQADTIARSIIGFSAHYKMDPRLVCAVILAESHFRMDATSHCGAQGLGQLMPGTAAGLGVNNAYDPVENVYGSVRYIRSMLDRVTGKSQWNDLTWYDLALALAAYNAGPGAVKKHGGIPPYRETQNYVRRVTSIYRKLCEG
ncbi:MAG: lytic transglycosylase domain-containing protein [Armatimonadetes bacterium]|nr:lytic transglycosylase domain-containing protein [Armatimonadota bacterium]